MAHIHLPPGWREPGRPVTSEESFWNRRRFLKSSGAALAAVALTGCNAGRNGGGEEGNRVAATRPAGPLDTIPETPSRDLYPALRAPAYTVDRPLTDRVVAATHNNFYEFTTDKARVWENVGPFNARPWTIEVTGEVETPGVFDVADLERELGLEERIYRFRCVEAWAMTVPWTGFPLHRLLAKVQPLSTARYVRFVTFNNPEEAVGKQTQPWYDWPYYEGLRMDEAMNELTLMATGLYGEPLPKQHGAPIRVVTPWKYGYKSAKSIVKIELVREEPPTFWNDLQPREYGFYSNVAPQVPHPRWSQATEELIGEGRRVPTLLFNGYEQWVGQMYDAEMMGRLS